MGTCFEYLSQGIHVQVLLLLVLPFVQAYHLDLHRQVEHSAAAKQQCGLRVLNGGGCTPPKGHSILMDASLAQYVARPGGLGHEINVECGWHFVCCCTAFEQCLSLGVRGRSCCVERV